MEAKSLGRRLTGGRGGGRRKELKIRGRCGESFEGKFIISPCVAGVENVISVGNKLGNNVSK